MSAELSHTLARREGSASPLPPAASQPVNRWIISEVRATARALEQAIADFRFDAYADAIYKLVWSRFCDWYLELIKPLLSEGADEAIAAETRAVAGWALDQILVMLHPVMPFLTEELWHRLAERDDLILAQWVATDAIPEDAAASADIDWLIGLISEVRSARTEVNVPPSAKPPLAFVAPDTATAERIARHRSTMDSAAFGAPRSQERNVAWGSQADTTVAASMIVPSSSCTARTRCGSQRIAVTRLEVRVTPPEASNARCSAAGTGQGADVGGAGASGSAVRATDRSPATRAQPEPQPGVPGDVQPPDQP